MLRKLINILCEYLKGMGSGEPALIRQHLGFATGAGTPSAPPCRTPAGSHPGRLGGGVVLVQARVL